MSESGQAQYGRVPTAMIAAGGLTRIKPSDAVVYLAIAGYAKPDMQATIGRRRIAEVTGFYMGRINDAINRLVKAGLLQITTPGGGTRPTTFRLSVPTSPNATDSPEFGATRTLETAQRSENGDLAFGKRAASVLTAPERIRGSGDQGEGAATDGQASLPGITPAKAKVDPIAFTFATTDGPVSMKRSEVWALRDEFTNVHVDTELAGLRDWLDEHPDRQKPAAGLRRWLKARLRTKAQEAAQRGRTAPACYDGWAHAHLPTDPTADEVDALLREE